MAENATIRVIVNAVTEAAEQSIENVGDEIANLSGDATVGQSAMDELADEFGEATAQSMVLQSAMDELDDELGDVGNNALYAQTAMDQLNDEITETTTRSAAASGMLSTLAGSMNVSAAASSALSMAFWLSLIPSIFTLTTILAPLVGLLVALAAGAAALAGAFGLIVGSGILAFGQKRAEQNEKELAQTERRIAQYEQLKEQTGALTASQQERLDQLREKRDKLEESTSAMGALKRQMTELKEELLPLIVAFGEEFVPLIKDALDAVPTLVQDMLSAVGGTDEFRNSLREFGRVLMDVLPALVGFMFDLARNALPYAKEFFGFLLENGGDAMDAIFESLQEIEPELRDFLDALIELGPELLDFGTQVTETVLPAVTDFIRGLTDLLEKINGLDEDTQHVIVSLLVLGPVILKLVKWLGILQGAITGKGLTAALGKLSSTLAGGGAVSSASVYGAAILAGAGLGILTVKALDAFGALQKVRQAGAGLREELGGEQADKILTGANLGTGGTFEGFSKFGGAVRGVALPGETVQGNLERIDRTFRNAERNAATQRDSSSDQSPDTTGRSRRDPLENAGDVNMGDINMNVDTTEGLERDPYGWSRTVAEQLQRETRQRYGAGR